ncbi:MAG: DNA (cytosine-5-)-methyltransferase [Blastocatellia bacterium]|nr:DNA (cytosine-5-)-methyltransferase [Blastocatellia bacterium]
MSTGYKHHFHFRNGVRQAMQPCFLEFFAGIGLVHLGLKASGWQCLYANDISAKKREMYLAEFPAADGYFHLADVWSTDEVVERIPEAALLATASFPCIDLSLAGRCKGLLGKDSSALFGFLKVMKKLKSRNRMPSCIMLENVAGLLTGRQGKDLEETCLAVSELGFYLDAFVIDAKHFTPQSRPRLFIVGFLEKLLPHQALFQQETGWEERLDNRKTACPSRLATAMRDIKLPTGWIALDLPALPPVQKDLIDYIDLDENQDWWDEATVNRHLGIAKEAHQKQIQDIQASGKTWAGTIFRRMREGAMRSEIRFDGLAGCLRTPKGGSGKQIVIAVQGGKVKMRWMSAIEYAKLQGAPSFNVNFPRNQALTGFADAVCVPVIEWIDKHVLSLVKDGAQPRSFHLPKNIPSQVQQLNLFT